MTTRAQDIARAIYSACLPFKDAEDTRLDARDAFDTAKDSVVSAREQVMVTVAALSATGSWTEKEIKEASKVAAALNNDPRTEKSLKTFIGEVVRAAHPNVRAHVPSLVRVRDDAWQAETDAKSADKASPTPLRKFAKRKYHLLTRMFGEAEEGRTLTTVEQVVAWARANDPDFDPEKALAKINSARVVLGAVYQVFPLTVLRECLDQLVVSESDLVKSRIGVVATPEPAPTKQAPAPQEGVMGVVDLDELMAGAPARPAPSKLALVALQQRFAGR